MKYKYKMDDVDCYYCKCKGRGKKSCSHNICPYIMSNLSDLFADCKFREAVKNAENCTTQHKSTLMRLKTRAIERGEDFVYEEPEFRCDFKPDNAKCNYSSNGFVCHNNIDGTCMKDWIRRFNNAGR